MTSPEAPQAVAPAREEVRFRSGEAECAGVLIRPDGGGEVPCVILAHGFGALKEGGPVRVAERFAEAGFAGLAFDYRYFGDSGGEPRQLLSAKRQLEDWRAAIAFARELEGVDGSGFGLWGSSYSGGHVMALAAEDRSVRAVIAQTPHVDGIKTLLSIGPVQSAKLTLAGLVDAVAGAVGREPRLIPIVGPPGTTAAMTTPDAAPGYEAMYNEDFEWRNEFTPREALALPFSSPGRRAGEIECPLLVQACSADAITPPGPAMEAAARAAKGEIEVFAGAGHFDIYRGDVFERAAESQVEFLKRHLT